MEIQEGEFISLIGPSGAGKTTFLRLLAGIEKPDNGSISFNAKYKGILDDRNPPVLVFQDFWLFPGLTVLQNIEFGLRSHKIPKTERTLRTENLLEDFKLSEHSHKYPRQLSGGQQQRVALARALAIQPKLLLLDEPFAHLDENLKAETALYLRNIHERYNLTTIGVTHDQEEAFLMADRIGYINKGILVQLDQPELLFSQPKSLELAKFLGPLLPLPHQFSPTKQGYYRPHQVQLFEPSPSKAGDSLFRGTISTATPRGLLYNLEILFHDHIIQAISPQHTYKPGQEVSFTITPLYFSNTRTQS